MLHADGNDGEPRPRHVRAGSGAPSTAVLGVTGVSAQQTVAHRPYADIVKPETAHPPSTGRVTSSRSSARLRARASPVGQLQADIGEAGEAERTRTRSRSSGSACATTYGTQIFPTRSRRSTILRRARRRNSVDGWSAAAFILRGVRSSAKGEHPRVRLRTGQSRHLADSKK